VAVAVAVGLQLVFLAVALHVTPAVAVLVGLAVLAVQTQVAAAGLVMQAVQQAKVVQASSLSAIQFKENLNGTFCKSC
jgi:hypothetical protein